MAVQSDVDALTASLNALAAEVNGFTVPVQLDLTALTSSVATAQAAVASLKTKLGE